MKSSLPFLLLLISPLVQAQLTYNILDYIPNGVGDSLVYEQMSSLTPDSLLVAWPSLRALRKDSVLYRIESTGGRRYETLDDTLGWKIYMIGLPNAGDLVLQNGLGILPPVVKHGETYRSSAPFTVIRDGKKQGSGTLEYAITVEGNDSSQTPFRNFGDCLVLNTLSVRTDPDGIRRGYQLKEWYARGLGLVKMAGEAFTLDHRQQRVRVIKAAGILVKGKVGGVSYHWPE